MKKILIILASMILAVVVLLIIIFISQPGFLSFFALQADSIRKAGTWEDDSKNWHRAFNEEQPAAIKVIHSKYWRSNHFTYEYMYFFEVEAPPEWKDAFMKKHGLEVVAPSKARSFRTGTGSDDTPSWFVPDPVENYEVWDKNGYFGSVWINKTNKHIYFYDIQL